MVVSRGSNQGPTFDNREQKPPHLFSQLGGHVSVIESLCGEPVPPKLCDILESAAHWEWHDALGEGSVVKESL